MARFRIDADLMNDLAPLFDVDASRDAWPRDVAALTARRAT